MMITGNDLIAGGFEPQPWFKKAIEDANGRNLSLSQALKSAKAFQKAWQDAQPKHIALQESVPFFVNMTAENAYEADNMTQVVDSFKELMRTPTIVAGAIMPDACQAGGVGTIPVGGVVGAKGAIHPGMHSADICCSMFVTVLDGVDPIDVLNAGQMITHFGPGGRADKRFSLPADLKAQFEGNKFLSNGKIMHAANIHLGTQGDGNHFFYVGTTASGQTAIVTHHGSRNVGAMLYKIGMKIAEDHRIKHSPDTLKANAWIPFDSREGQEYWSALQILRSWTKENHRVLHDAVAESLGAKISRRLWNEHNFVFQEDDIFWHAKGATPVHAGYLPDSDGVQIIPMNMAQPILLVTGGKTERNFGFAPHGAGRNMSRSAHKKLKGDKTDLEIFQEETAGIDARFFSSNIDISELPSAYKDADSVQRDMERFNLARVVERIEPFGCVMAGDCELDAPWKRKKPKPEPDAGDDLSL